MDRWEEIWNRRGSDADLDKDFGALVLELKRLNGFDVVKDAALSSDIYTRHMREVLDRLGDGIDSLYEVGCGSGANLVMCMKEGIGTVGGIDFCRNFVDIASKVTSSSDITYGEAAAVPVRPVYDAVIIDSVCQYFPSEEYAYETFERMVRKASKCVAMLDIHDAALRREWANYRRSVIEDYDEKYTGLDDAKLFFSKEFFERFASSHGLFLEFGNERTEGYWNALYAYNVYMFK